jgi:hypothetical protein
MYNYIPNLASGMIIKTIGFIENIFLLNDNFTTTASAPLISPRSAEPTGTETLVQTDGQFSIADSKLVFPAQATPVWGDQGFYDAVARTRTNGLALYARVRVSANGGAGAIIGFASSGSVSHIALDERAWYILSSSLRLINAAGTNLQIGFGLTNYVDYDLAIIENASRVYYWTRGGGRSEWSLGYVDVPGSSNIRAMFGNNNVDGLFDAFRVAQLGSPFTSDYGAASYRNSGSVSAGTTFSHSADFVMEFTVTLPSSGNAIIYVRKIDANNFTYFFFNSSGGGQLRELRNGVDTLITTYSSVATGHRVVVVFDGLTCTLFSNDVQRVTISLLSNVLYSATSGEVNSVGTGGAISNLVIYTRRAASTILTQLNLLLRSAVRSDLLHDSFSTAGVASPRTCDVSGRLLITDTTSKMAISGGELVCNGTNISGDPRAMSEQSYTRSTGIAFYANFTIDSWSSFLHTLGFNNNNTARPQIHSFNFDPASFQIRANTTAFTLPESVLSTGVQYQVCMILRTSGAFYLIKGGVYTSWTLVFADYFTTSATLFGGLGSNAPAINFLMRVGKMQVAQLYGKWLSNYGIATTHLQGSISAGQAFTHEADFQMEWTQTTVPSANETQNHFRQQDASNNWRTQINSTGGIELYEQVATVFTLRGSAAAVVTNGHKISVKAKAATIITYSNGVQRFSYASATNFQTATSGEVFSLGTGGAIADLGIFEADVPSDAITELDRVFA